MKLLKPRNLLAAVILILMTGSAHASIVWNWSNAATGTETGTFTTDGDLVGGLATAGTYNVTDFSLDTTSTTLALGSASGGQYAINQPDVGFLWDGNAPTQFFRASGNFTNGFSFGLDPDPGLGALSEVIFVIDFFSIDSSDELSFPPGFILESQTVNLAPVAVPEPSALVVWSLASLVIVGRRHRRRGRMKISKPRSLIHVP